MWGRGIQWSRAQGRGVCAKALGWDEGQRREVWAWHRLTWGQGWVWG